ncbi:MAG TPA: hypothetical protein VF723_09215 [Pyrinomonadaceae bacterium]|jgi:hypothetical protein
MMTYLAFIFALALACIAGVEFVCLMVLETGNRQLKRRVAELEGENRAVRQELEKAEETLQAQAEQSEEWPELIDDDSVI